MSKKLIPTWLKLAGLATLVPYQIVVKKDGSKLKNIRVRSLAYQLSYTAPADGKKGKIDGVFPGFNADKVTDAEGKKHKVNSEEFFDEAFAVYDDVKHAAHEVKEAFEDALDAFDDDEFDDITADVEKFVN